MPRGPGRPREMEDRQVIRVTASRPFTERVKALAAEEDRSLAAMTRKLIAEALAARDAKALNTN